MFVKKDLKKIGIYIDETHVLVLIKGVSDLVDVILCHFKGCFQSHLFAKG